MIEAALRECGGRVSGPSGAAQKLGMPGSTLESKIKTLKINKNRFKASREAGQFDCPSKCKSTAFTSIRAMPIAS